MSPQRFLPPTYPWTPFFLLPQLAVFAFFGGGTWDSGVLTLLGCGARDLDFRPSHTIPSVCGALVRVFPGFRLSSGLVPFPRRGRVAVGYVVVCSIFLLLHLRKASAWALGCLGSAHPVDGHRTLQYCYVCGVAPHPVWALTYARRRLRFFTVAGQGRQEGVRRLVHGQGHCQPHR